MSAAPRQVDARSTPHHQSNHSSVGRKILARTVLLASPAPLVSPASRARHDVPLNASALANQRLHLVPSTPLESALSEPFPAAISPHTPVDSRSTGSQRQSRQVDLCAGLLRKRCQSKRVIGGTEAIRTCLIWPAGLSMLVLIGSILTNSPRTGNPQGVDSPVCFVLRRRSIPIRTATAQQQEHTKHRHTGVEAVILPQLANPSTQFFANLLNFRKHSRSTELLRLLHPFVNWIPPPPEPHFLAFPGEPTPPPHHHAVHARSHAQLRPDRLHPTPPCREDSSPIHPQNILWSRTVP